jgi:hypothetical protein
MRPSNVVVLDPFAHHSLKVSVPQDEEPIEALSTPRTDLTLHVGVGFRCRDRSLDHPDALSSQHSIALSSELRVVVVDEVADRRSSSFQTRFRLCCVTQAVSGCEVTPNHKTGLVASSIYKRT